MLKVAIKRDEEVKGGVGGDDGHREGGRDKEDLEMNCFKGGNSVVTVLIALSLEFWKCEQNDFYALILS